MITRHLSILLIWSFLGSACAQNKTYNSPAGYNLEEPEKFLLPDVLTEVSGIAFLNGNAETVYAQQDEDGKVFYFRLGDDKLSSLKFAPAADYEDLSFFRDQLLVLRSNGTLFAITLQDIRQSEATNVKEYKKLLPKGEYEGLYADGEEGLVYALCKECKTDKDDTVTGYILKGEDLTVVDEFKIDVKAIRALGGIKEKKFKPSALAKNRRTGEWYILSSVNRMLVVADTGFKVKEVYTLKPSVFLQPEGMHFDNKHNLYISNEGDELSRGNILRFNYTHAK